MESGRSGVRSISFVSSDSDSGLLIWSFLAIEYHRHTSVVVWDREIFYGAGVMETAPGRSHVSVRLSFAYTTCQTNP
jgi:hypothetical protein